VILRAAAALPHDDGERASVVLSQQLRVMATAAGATPQWTTLTVTGPTEMAGADEETRFEWTALVTVHPNGALETLPDEALRDLHDESSGSTP